MKFHRTLGGLAWRSGLPTIGRVAGAGHASFRRANIHFIYAVISKAPKSTAVLTWLAAKQLFSFATVVQCFALAQSVDSKSQGLNRVESGRHLTIVTDLPIDDEIKSLPAIFDQAMPLWSDFFSMSSQETKSWQVTMYLMLDRQRFRQAGLLPKDVPEFQHGWQSGDRIWINEQPSPYYRRHLMLHEGTHWFMQRKYGKYHAPWLMEGLAEWLATHRIQDGILQLGIIPADKQEVPYWGRISLIQQQTLEGISPGMDEIWRYSNTAHQRVDAYAWSWAMVQFLRSHPRTAKLIKSLLKQPAMDTEELNRWMRSRLRQLLPKLRAEWAAFIAELEYGYTDEPGMLTLSERTEPLSSEVSFEVDSCKGWQPTGIRVRAEQQIEISAIGKVTLALEPRPWISYPDGVTLEYYRGNPLGKLMMAVVTPLEDDCATQIPQSFPVGSHSTLSPKTGGEILFRINEANAKLRDNSGTITVKVRPAD